MILNPLRSGLALGALVALFHLAWSVLVAAGWAQAVIDFILHIHFLRLPVQLDPFSLATAATLVAVTFVVGFLMGWIFAVTWNWLHRRDA